uniref:Putative vesicle coat complex copii subunit sfb3 n=1 Tax=Lutzomyia longipalpis TaxID=7200 RepID=A0A1B0ETR7_LUTLO
MSYEQQRQPMYHTMPNGVPPQMDPRINANGAQQFYPPTGANLPHMPPPSTSRFAGKKKEEFAEKEEENCGRMSYEQQRQPMYHTMPNGVPPQMDPRINANGAQQFYPPTGANLPHMPPPVASNLAPTPVVQKMAPHVNLVNGSGATSRTASPAFGGIPASQLPPTAQQPPTSQKPPTTQQPPTVQQPPTSQLPPTSNAWNAQRPPLSAPSVTSQSTFSNNNINNNVTTRAPPVSAFAPLKTSTPNQTFNLAAGVQNMTLNSNYASPQQPTPATPARPAYPAQPFNGQPQQPLQYQNQQYPTQQQQMQHQQKMQQQQMQQHPMQHQQMQQMQQQQMQQQHPMQQMQQPHPFINNVLSATHSGFNRLWGNETVDLLENRHILPPGKIQPPPNKDQPAAPGIGQLQPRNLPVIQCSTIVRCRACRTYINPFVLFVDSKKWKCNLCYRVNELPDEFQYDPTYGDVTRRPEVRSSTIEFIAPSEYMLRPPQPAIYLFLLDVSNIAVQSGYLNTVCDTLMEHLDNLPGDVRTQVGFITFSSTVNFYHLADGFNQPHEITVLDIDDVFLPCPDNLLVNLKECRDLIKDLLTQLPKRFANVHEPKSALGAALQAAFKMMSSSGGRVTVFQACLPNYGPGALQSREDPNNRSSKEVNHLGPATDFYKRLALECSGQQIAVDLFLMNSQYSDLATLSGISKFSGGCIHHFPLFNHGKAQQVEFFKRCFERYLTRKIGFEAVMRVRCTRGLAIHTFHGNFFVRSTDLLSLPNINPDAGFGMQIVHEESLSDLRSVCFQAALLYTSSKGERRIRVHTLCLPVASSLTEILYAADVQCMVGLLVKMAVDRSLTAAVSDARDALINATVDVLCAFKVAQNLPSAIAGQVVAPQNLALLPLYISAILKHPAFRVGTSTRLDDRVFSMCEMKTLPLDQLMRYIYPDFYNIDCLFENPTEKVEPSRMHLSAERLDSRSIFLLDCGMQILIFNLPVIQCSTIVRCRACRTYINPFVLFVDSKKWKCNLCYRVNELPDEFQYDPTYGDVTRRPEVRSSTIEFIAPSEYMLRPPQPAIYLFLLDVSNIAVQSGYLNTVCDTLMEHLDNLPGDVRTQVGFITFSSTVNFYHLADGFNQPHEITVLDIDDVFLPCPDNLLVNLKECRDLIKDLLTQLPKRFANVHEPKSALGAALQAAFKMMSSSGGRVTVFQACLPNYGPGALQSREDPNNRSSKEVNHLGPATDFYKRLALECSGQQIAVDLFLMNSQYSDLATLSGISKFSGGCIHHFPLFNHGKAQQVEFFKRCFERYLTRKIGFEAVMRVRCTRGLAIHTFHGNFFVRSTDLLSLPNINPDAGFGMQIVHEESLSDLRSVCFQAALLYTSSKGERRIRVHTLCLPVASSLTEILYAADVQCMVGLLVKMAVDRSLTAAVSDARDALINATVDVLCAFKVAQNLPSAIAGQVVAPQNLALLPLYISAILKHPAFRVGTSTRLDDRVFSMCEMKTLPLDQLMRYIYPDFYNIDCLFENPTEKVEPSRMHLSAERLDSRSIFLLDCGMQILIFVGTNAQPKLINSVFGVPSTNDIPDLCFTLQNTGTPESEALNAFIESLNEEKPFAASIQIIRDSSSYRSQFTEKLIDDRTDNSLSYYEFLQHLRCQVK